MFLNVCFMEQKKKGRESMEELLYESSGTPLERKEALKRSSVVLIVCGICLLLFGYEVFTNGPSRFEEFGLFLCMLGLVSCAVAFVSGVKSMNDNNNIRQLAIYTNHIEIYDQSSRKYLSFEWKEIYKVGKMSVFGSNMLILETEKGNYTVSVNDLNKAHHIIEQNIS